MRKLLVVLVAIVAASMIPVHAAILDGKLIKSSIPAVKHDYAAGLVGHTLRVTKHSYADGSSEHGPLVIQCRRPYGVDFPLTFGPSHPSFLDLGTMVDEDSINSIRITKVLDRPAGNPNVLGSWVKAEVVWSGDVSPAPAAPSKARLTNSASISTAEPGVSGDIEPAFGFVPTDQLYNRTENRIPELSTSHLLDILRVRVTTNQLSGPERGEALDVLELLQHPENHQASDQRERR